MASKWVKPTYKFFYAFFTHYCKISCMVAFQVVNCSCSKNALYKKQISGKLLLNWNRQILTDQKFWELTEIRDPLCSGTKCVHLENNLDKATYLAQTLTETPPTWSRYPAWPYHATWALFIYPAKGEFFFVRLLIFLQ